MQRKKFKTVEEAVEWLESQMIKARLQELYQEQLAYLDEAVLKSNLTEANEVIKHIMRL